MTGHHPRRTRVLKDQPPLIDDPTFCKFIFRHVAYFGIEYSEYVNNLYVPVVAITFYIKGWDV